MQKETIKEISFIMIKGSIQEDTVKIVNIHVPNKNIFTQSKYQHT